MTSKARLRKHVGDCAASSRQRRVRLGLTGLALAVLLPLGTVTTAGASPLGAVTTDAASTAAPTLAANRDLTLFHPAGASAGVLAATAEPLIASSDATTPTKAASAAGLSCALPDAPGTPAATGAANSATISWAAANGEGSTVTGYIVREATGPNVGASIATNGSAASAILTGLSGGSAATFSIAAVTSCGTGAAATTSAVTPSGSASTYLASVLSNSPSLFYRLDEPSGTIMADSSGNTSDGTYTGQGTPLAAAPLASDPAPSTSYTTCCSGIGNGTSTVPAYGNPRTVEAWMKTTSGTGNQAILGWGTTSTDDGFVLSISAGSINVDAYNDYLSFPTPRPINTGTWHMLAASYDGTTVSVYLDGLLVGSSPFSGVVNTTPGAPELAGFPGYNMFNGQMGDVAIFPTALTGSQVNAHFLRAGYGRPSAVAVPHAATGGDNAVQISWGASTAKNASITSYIVSPISGEHGPSLAVDGDSTAARLTGLAAGTYTFQITPIDAYGQGSSVTTNSFTVTGAPSTYASTVIGSGPSAFYRLADTTSSAMADSSGHGATGVYEGGALLGQPGPLPNDNAPAISNTTNALIAGSNASLPYYAGSRTLEGWVNTTYCCGTQYIAGYGTESTAQGFGVGIQANAVFVTGWGDDLTFASPVALNDGVWHFIAVRTDGNSVSAYVDGAAIGTQYFPQLLDTLPGMYPQRLLIGSDIGNCCGAFNGQLADVAIFPSQLSVSKIASEFAASGLGRPPAPSGVSATAGPNQATVSWTAPTGANPDVTGYLITALNNGAAGNAMSVPATATSATLTGLAGGSPYTFNVQAVNAYGPGTAATTSAPVTPSGASATYATTTISLSPRAFYRLADSFTGLMADSSGHASNGYYSSAAGLGQTGPLSNDPATAMSDNATNIAGQGTPTLPLYGSSRTLEAWINTTNCCSSPWLAAYGNTSTAQGFAIGANANSVLVSGYSDDLTFPSPAPLTNGVWHFIAVTTSGNSVTAYVDGNVIGTQTFPQPLDTLPLGHSPQGLLIGAGIGNCCGNFNGQLADVALFTSTLSTARIDSQWAASGLGTPPAPTSPNASAGANQATVTWTAPSGAVPSVTGYLVTALKSGAAANAITVPAGATTATLTGLVAGGSYTFRVQAINAYGPGAAATTSTPVTPTGTASTYASTVLSATPSVFYRLADTGSAALADSSGNGANGAYNTNAVTLNQTGPLGSDNAAAVSDNGQSPLASAHPSLPLYNSPRSVELWIKTTACCGQQLVAYGSTNTNQGFAVGASANSISVSGYNDDFSLASPVPLNNNVWHFIVVTTDGTSVTVYVDGAAIGTRNFPSTLNTIPAVQGLLLGNGIGGCCGGYSGQMADVAIFPAQLSSAQVSAEFAASGLSTPAAPTAPGATAGTNQATVSWTDVPTANPPIQGYLVTALKSGAAANSVAVASTASSATITGLAGGTAYTFRIQAVNSYGPGAAATTSAVTPGGPSSTYASTVLSASPSAFYRLADTTSSVLADSSGHGATGAYGSAATLNQPGPLASDPVTAITDNASTYAAQAAPSLPINNAARTVEGWVNTTNSNTNYIAGYGATNTAQGFMLDEQPNSVYVSGYNDDVSIPSPTRLNDGSWHFIAATTDGTSVTAYVDGRNIGTHKLPQTLNTEPSTSGLLIGFGTGSCCGGLNGGLADVAVFPAALSDAQMSAEFAASGLGVPAAPTSPSATAGANQATVSWVAPASSVPAVSGYLVTAVTGGVAANAQSVPAGTTSTTITGLAGGTSYTFRIQAVNEYGAGAAATTSAVSPTGATATYASTTLSYSPSVFYRLGDTGPSALADSSGHGATGTYNSSATLGQPGPITGDASGAASDNGSGALGQGHPTLPLYNQPRTIEAWMKTTYTGSQALVSYGKTVYTQAFGLSAGPTTIYLYSWSNDVSFTSPTLDDGNWHFIAVTTDGTNATAYVDGTSIGTQTFAHPLDTLAAPEGLIIGQDSQFYCCSFNGSLANIGVFPSALSAAQISAQESHASTGAPVKPGAGALAAAPLVSGDASTTSTSASGASSPDTSTGTTAAAASTAANAATSSNAAAKTSSVITKAKAKARTVKKHARHKARTHHSARKTAARATRRAVHRARARQSRTTGGRS